MQVTQQSTLRKCYCKSNTGYHLATRLVVSTHNTLHQGINYQHS